TSVVQDPLEINAAPCPLKRAQVRQGERTEIVADRGFTVVDLNGTLVGPDPHYIPDDHVGIAGGDGAVVGPGAPESQGLAGERQREVVAPGAVEEQVAVAAERQWRARAPVAVQGQAAPVCRLDGAAVAPGGAGQPDGSPGRVREDGSLVDE